MVHRIVFMTFLNPEQYLWLVHCYSFINREVIRMIITTRTINKVVWNLRIRLSNILRRDSVEKQKIAS